MTMSASLPIRNPCPPGACVCGLDALLENSGAVISGAEVDLRILKLTREEEKRLCARIEQISSHAELQRIQQRLFEQLGVVLRIAPGPNEVRTVRGLDIQLEEQACLCRKTRLAVAAAIRRCLERNPQIVYAILNAHDLLGDE
jgi:hypothetical protein